MAPTYSTIPTTPDADEESLLVNASKDAKPRLRLGAAAVVMAFALGATVAYVAPSKSTTSASLASSQGCDGSSCSPLGVAKAWKAYDDGKYAGDCVTAMAIALGEGIQPYNPHRYIRQYCSPLFGDGFCFPGPPSDNFGNGQGPVIEDLEAFMTDTRIFDLNQEPQFPGDDQKTLGPWQTMTTVLSTNDIDVRIGEAIDYIEEFCNPNCPGTRPGDLCDTPFSSLPATNIFSGSRLKWCGCATTSSPDPSKQTLGYSGRCVNAAADYYTKYEDLGTTYLGERYEGLAKEICNRA